MDLRPPQDPVPPIANLLKCPISLELFVDPILLPCCGQAVSRDSLIAWFNNHPPKTCVLCRANLDTFQPAHVTVIRALKQQVEDFMNQQKANAPVAAPAPAPAVAETSHQWSAALTPVVDSRGRQLPVSELRLSLEHALFRVRPTLFVAVVDRSGSMAGSPWRQVQDGLLHMIALARSNAMVRMEVITYNSTAQLVDLGATELDAVRVIRSMQAEGGTHFRAAFARVKELLQKYTYQPDGDHAAPNAVSSVTIAFLTDGQANEQVKSRTELSDEFQCILAETWPAGPLTVHAIGFSRECDKVFLEGMWHTGSLPGTFRYAEPDENGDSLSRKLTTLFDHVARHSTVTVSLDFEEIGGRIYDPRAQAEEAAPAGPSASAARRIEIQFPLNESRNGTYRCWLEGARVTGRVRVASALDKDVLVAVQDGRSLPAYKLHQRPLFTRWLSALTDALAAELLQLSNSSVSPQLRRLHASLIEQKIEVLLRDVSGDDNTAAATRERLEVLAREAASVLSGASINAGRVGDLRFGAQYVPNAPQIAPVAAAAAQNVGNAIAQRVDSHDEPVVRYPRAHREHIRRSPLQDKVLQTLHDSCGAGKSLSLSSVSRDDLVHRDSEGNTLLMLVAYCGHRRLIRQLLDAAKAQFDQKDALLDYLNATNEDKESALTLAIKARGFTDCTDALLQAGAAIPSSRRDALIRFCVNKRFARTAALLSSFAGDQTLVLEPDERDSVEVLTYQLHRALRAGAREQVKWAKFLAVAIQKSSADLACLLLEQAPTLVIDVVQHLWPLCVLDDKDAERVRIIDALAAYLTKHLSADELRTLANQHEPTSGDSLLFHASDRGSPKMLDLALKWGAKVDGTNILGNTPLWIACERRWPCIVTSLLLAGADPNHANLKGNTPLITICQKGTRALAEQLLAHGADINRLNANGDTALLICCRNGQHDVLRLLLDRAEPEIVQHVAAIDGFDAMLASTEADRPDCIKVLHEYGLSIERRTSADNAILAGGTSLHLASYYGRESAMRMLLSLGADANARDANGQTPLHTAVIRGNAPIVKLLRDRCDLHARDSAGNTAATYCRNEALRVLLISPLLEPLMHLAHGAYGSEQAAACSLLRRSMSIGCLQPSELIDIRSTEGRTILSEAVIYSNVPVTELLLSLDSRIETVLRADLYGVDAWNWANITGNQRLKRLLSDKTAGQLPPPTAPQRLQECARAHPADATLLFLGSPPAVSPEPAAAPAWEHLGVRMSRFGAVCVPGQAPPAPPASAEAHFSVDCETAVTKSSSARSLTTTTPNFPFDAKVFCISKVLEHRSAVLSPRQIAALYMYDQLAPLLLKAGAVDHPFGSVLHDALQKLSPFDGEVFVGTRAIDRARFLPGAEVHCDSFLSCSSVWCVATEHIPEFTAATAAKRCGVVFLIHSRSGRLISQYARHAYDMEVLFMPRTAFRVTNWYRGDVICLGQANIRQHTFGVKEKDRHAFLVSEAPLIVEMEELCPTKQL